MGKGEIFQGIWWNHLHAEERFGSLPRESFESLFLFLSFLILIISHQCFRFESLSIFSMLLFKSTESTFSTCSWHSLKISSAIRSADLSRCRYFGHFLGNFYIPKNEKNQKVLQVLVHWSHWTLLEILERWDSAIGARSFRNPPWQSLAPYHFPKCNTCNTCNYLRRTYGIAPSDTFCIEINVFQCDFVSVLWVVSWKIQNQYTDSTRTPRPHTLPILWCLCRSLPEPGLGTRRINESDAKTSFSDSQVGCIAHRYIIDISWYVMIMYSISYADFPMNDKAAVPRSPWNMFHSERCWLRLVRTERRK